MFNKIICFCIAIIYFVLISTCLALPMICLIKKVNCLSDLPQKPKAFSEQLSNATKFCPPSMRVRLSIRSKECPGLTLVKLPENLKVKDALPKLRGKGEFLYVEPNYKIKFLSTFPNDLRFGELWAMHNTGQFDGIMDADIDAPEAWDIITDSNVIVAVIDTGVDYTHPDSAANMWINAAEIPGNGIDDDGNGYIDDIYGYDFSGYTPDDQDSNPMDEDGHGTHCAGIIGAVGNNNRGVTGVCWNVQIMALKIMPPYSGGLDAFVSNAVEAIGYAAANNAKVINASWSIYNNYSQALKDSIDDAGDAGVLFIAAAGNEGYDNDITPSYPASYDCDNIISVMATDHYDNKASFSNYGPISVDLGDLAAISLAACLLICLVIIMALPAAHRWPCRTWPGRVRWYGR